MKIRFIQTAATDRQTFVEGREIELPDEVAQGHIRSGHAVEVGGLVTGAGAAGVSLLRLSGIGALVAAGFAAVTSIGKGFKLSEDLEKTQLQFSALIGDSGKAKTAIGNLIEFAKSTPFKVGSIIDASRELLAFGVSNDNLIPSLKAIGDVAAGVGQPLDEIVKIFGLVAETGKLSERELRQFGKAGIPVVAELAKRFGVTTKEIDAMATAGTIGFKDLQAVFQNMTGPAGKFGGQMEKQSKTLGGSMTILGDAIEGQLGKVADTFVEVFGLKGGISAASGAVEKIGSAFNSGLVYVGPILVRFTTSTYQAFAGIWTRVEPTISRVWRGIQIAWGLIVGVVETNGPAIWQSITSTWETVYGYVADVAGKIWKVVSDNWESIVKSTVTYGMAVWNYMSSAWNGLVEIASSVWNGIAQVWTWGHNLISGENVEGASSVSSTWNDIVGVFRWVQNSVSLVFNTLAYVFKNWQAGLELVGLGAGLAIVTFANQVEYFFTDVVGTVLVWFGDNWRDVFTDLWNFTKTVMGNLGENVVNVFTHMPDLIAGTMKFGDVWGPLTAGFQSTLKSLPQIAERQMGGLEKELNDKLNIAGGDFGDGLGKYLAEQEGSAKDASHKIINGIKTVLDGSKIVPPVIEKPKIPTPDPLKTRLDPDTLSVSIAPVLKSKAIRSGSAESQMLQFAVPRNAALAAAGAPLPPGAPMAPIQGHLPPMAVPDAWKPPTAGVGISGGLNNSAKGIGGAVEDRILEVQRQIQYWNQRIEQNTRPSTVPTVVSIA